MKSIVFLFIINSALSISAQKQNLVKRALQKSHEKSQLEKWEDKFFRRKEDIDQAKSLVNLISSIAIEELSGCTAIILYDKFTQNSDDLLLMKLFGVFPIPYLHGQITNEYNIKYTNLLSNLDTCVHYILFLKDVMRSRNVIGPQMDSKVIIVARSSQWRVYEFLANEESQSFMNLLVIVKSEKIVSAQIELPYILYTHTLYVDALGSSVYKVLASWKNNSFSRSRFQLFPPQIVNGFSGHRFIISVAHRPPFVIKKSANEDNDLEWDGIEIRLINLLSKMYNFSTDYKEALSWTSSSSVVNAVKHNKANLGIAGLYITEENLEVADMSVMHSQDCASFISLASTALPRYRAIMGPFHWSVWLTLTLTYLVAIFPLVYSDKHSFNYLREKPQEVENMFWYVFGTFTNAFSFETENSWSKSNKIATRLLIGFYWIFTIIITACYTGSIIAFVTLPVYPATVDTPEQLLRGRYQIGTLDKGGWQNWFQNTSDKITKKLFKNIDLVPDIHSGLKNITKAFFWPYAFLGSRAQLDYIVRTNFTTMNKRSLLHISSQCFVPFGVGLIYNKKALYSKILNLGILKIDQSGIIHKIKKDVEWQMIRSSTGKLLAANSFGNPLVTLTVEDRALTLDDTQGMFLLLGIGFLLGAASLFSEWMGGCFRLCKRKRKTSESSIQSNNRLYEIPTPREKMDAQLLKNRFKDSNELSNDEQVNSIDHKSEIEEFKEDVEDHIDKLFNFDKVFGEANSGTKIQEELKELDNLNQ